MLGLTLQSQLQRFGKGSGGKEDVGKQTGNEKPKGGFFSGSGEGFKSCFQKDSWLTVPHLCSLHSC